MNINRQRYATVNRALRRRGLTIGRRIPRRLVRVREQPSRLVKDAVLWDGRDFYVVNDLHQRPTGVLHVELYNRDDPAARIWFPVLLDDAQGVGVLWYADSWHRRVSR